MATTARILPFERESEPVEETTHETFVHAVRAAVVGRVSDPAARERLQGAKLVYGGGPGGVRGLTYNGAWKNGCTHDFIEVAATGEENHVQLAGTTLHELAHTLAGPGTGHGREWKAACAVLGLQHAEAAGQEYSADHFEAAVWAKIEALPHPSDGQPTFQTGGSPAAPRLRLRPRPCSLGIGTRGGRSRGAGSGSRMRLYVCSCPEGTPGRKIRTACDDLDATCNRCGERYRRG